MKKYIHISSVAIMTIATACSNIETENTLTDETMVMRIEPCITMQSQSRVSSPSENTFVFDEQDAIGISIVNKGASLTGIDELNFNTKFSWANGSWQQEKQTYWLNDAVGIQNDIIGYYPYVSDVSQPTALSLNLVTDQRTITQMAQCDYLWGRTTVTKSSSNAPVALQMGHVMTKLTFNVKLSGKYESYQGIENLKIFSRSRSSLNLNSGTVSASGNFTSVVPYKKVEASAGYHQTYEAIIAPQNYSEDEFITFTLAGKNYSQPFSHSLSQGKHYTFLISANEDAAPTLLLISEVNINNWQSGETDDETITTIPQYKVGDLWPNEESPVAIVLFERIDNRYPGILMTLKKERSRLVRNTSYNKVIAELLSSDGSGKIKTKRIKEYIIKNNLSWDDFPAIQACAALGDEWFIPNYYELDNAISNFYYYKGQEGWFEYIGSSGEDVAILTSSFDDYYTSYIVGHFETAIDAGWSAGGIYASTTTLAQMRAFRYY